MLSNNEFVRQSLELNLFFMRIAKEHSIFLEAGFTTRDHAYIEQSEMFKNVFSELLMDTIRLSEGIIKVEAVNSGEYVTDLTLDAEAETQFYTNIKIDSKITRMTAALSDSSAVPITMNTISKVDALNRRALKAATELAVFKSNILNNVLACRMFTTNYPLLINHILREAKFYIRMLNKLQQREELDLVREAIFQETFWNRIMAEHAKFIRGLLDPTEEKLFNTADDFGRRFDKLTEETRNLSQNLSLVPVVTEQILKNTIDIQSFKRQGTEGLIQCKIKSIAFPLLGDHVVREANHYIRLLRGFQQKVEE